MDELQIEVAFTLNDDSNLTSATRLAALVAQLIENSPEVENLNSVSVWRSDDEHEEELIPNSWGSSWGRS